MVKTERATFGAGCFWGVEASFREVKGVISTRVGFMGGWKKNPSYKLVCTGMTGHVEVCEVIYNPKKVSYKKLLETFWKIHDPTQKNRQGFDIGSQYRSVIFYYSLEQKKQSEESLAKQQEKLLKKIQTQIVKSSEFYEAEEYHQNYLEKNKKETFNNPSYLSL
ncbi:MAG: peptide-methionine (S)-S-oxide reductase MsrA [Candidatus Woesearchaeota archaeon]|nr:MAG: peptide-methionine (S)-S-oxide reductase MsrA [Candidatus Woesearchaeota archaeon]